MFKALYVAPEVKSISNDDRNEVLELLSSFYDLSGCKPRKRGQMMDAWNWMMNSRRR